VLCNVSAVVWEPAGFGRIWEVGLEGQYPDSLMEPFFSILRGWKYPRRISLSTDICSGFAPLESLFSTTTLSSIYCIAVLIY
jgi:hypothetical protein